MFGSFTLVAGPCVLEDHELNLAVAGVLADCSRRFSLPVVFKASFDKANRSRIDAPRGPGLEAGLAALERVAGETGLRVLTDIHEPWQARRAAAVVDALQIPAFLCRQTDLLVAAGETGLPVNLKKGQWMAPEEMAGAVEKVRAGGASQVVVCERGSMMGYGDLVVDMRSFARTRAACGVRVLFDGTHAVQRPGQLPGGSGGDREHVSALVRAAVAAGCDGLFLEVHPRPAEAPSDAATMLGIDRLPALLGEVIAVRQALAPEPGQPF